MSRSVVMEKTVRTTILIHESVWQAVRRVAEVTNGRSGRLGLNMEAAFLNFLLLSPAAREELKGFAGAAIARSKEHGPTVVEVAMQLSREGFSGGRGAASTPSQDPASSGHDPFAQEFDKAREREQRPGAPRRPKGRRPA